MCHTLLHGYALDHPQKQRSKTEQSKADKGQHRPFVADGVHDLVKRIAPDYVTYEYITRDRDELKKYLTAGVL